jgi:hypothetical protein
VAASILFALNLKVFFLLFLFAKKAAASDMIAVGANERLRQI